MQKLKISIDFDTNKGIKSENQDACNFVIPVDNAIDYKGVAAVIADGVSASSHAKDASMSCVSGFLADYYATPDSWSVDKYSVKVILALNTWLYSQSITGDEKLLAHSKNSSSMLSTLSILILKSNTAHIFHIGDSHIYRFRKGVLGLITKDHTVHFKKQKTYLARAMGFDVNVNIDYKTFEMQNADEFLLTTDGIHDYLSLTELTTLMKNNSPSKDFIKQALANNSEDNLSAMRVKVENLPIKNITEALEELTQKPLPPELETGMKINGFEIVKLLNSSAKIQLYLAKDLATKTPVVLKTPSVNFEDDASYLMRFSYEQWAGKRIKNPCVPSSILGVATIQNPAI